MNRLPGGVWPVMLTPFTTDGAVDYDGLDAVTDWYIDRGVAGLFAVCLSSEMYHLDDPERMAVARRVVDRADGRVPVVATGTFVDEPASQVEMVKRMHGTGVDAVVVITAQMAAQDQSADVWKANLDALMAATDDIPLGFYECPRPYHRVLDAETLGWCASSGRFGFIKETSAKPDLVKAKIEAADGTPLGIYDACGATILTSLRNGAPGYCGVAANLYPELFVWLCEHFADAPDVADRLQSFLAVVDRAVGHGYPVSAKQYMKSLGLPVTTTCRTTDTVLTGRDELTLEHLNRLVTEWWDTLELDVKGAGAARGHA